MGFRRFGFAVLVAALAAAPAQAATYKVLHNFCAKAGCIDGKLPLAGLNIDADGNLYGTASRGGRNDAGVVFRLADNGTGYTYKAIYNFADATGSGPEGSLLLGIGGRIYGTTRDGGSTGAGTIFDLRPNKTQTRWFFEPIYTFCSRSGCSDGAHPVSGLYFNSTQSGFNLHKGEAYGVTWGGGNNDGGTSYLLTQGGVFPRHNFCFDGAACSTGDKPNGEMARNADTDLCFTLREGGNYAKGVLLCDEIGGGDWLHHFCGEASCADGATPMSGVTNGVAGTGLVWGTTFSGGANNGGEVYNVYIGPGRAFQVAYSFCSKSACADGQNPIGGMILDGATFYGTTSAGGNGGGGTLFSLTQAGTETVLHHFCTRAGCPDGSAPQGSLIGDGAGHLFGIAPQGGTHGGGVVFELTL